MAAQFLVEKKFISGAVGQIELAAHIPENCALRAVAVVAHPHPLFGGTMDNKVTTTLARACFDCGAATYRFNFRGVGKSEGTHDEGRGETADLVAVIQYAKTAHPNLPLWLAGFSFGGAVALAASKHSEIGAISEMVLVAPAFERMSHWENASSGDAAPAATLLIHGEKDETVPLVDSFTWAMTREIAVCVIPGADHFFHSRLHIIRRLVLRHFGGSLVIL